MAEILSINFKEIETTSSNATIDITKVISTRRKLEYGIIQPCDSEVHVDVVDEHAAEPIKDLNEIKRISKHLINQKRYRDNMLFIVGINFGLRVSDLLQLRFTHLIDNNLTFRTSFPILEKKTRNTRKVKRNRYISINNAVMDAVTLYLEHTECKLDDYMFRSERNTKAKVNKPMTRAAVDQMLKSLADELSLSNRMATHSLRKTFGYHQMVMSNNDPRKLLLLQKIYGHSSAGQTLDYIGITNEEIEEAYLKLNLGADNDYLIDSMIGEAPQTTVS